MASERYERLHEKYLADGESLLRTGDLPQASEKFWGAVAQMIKAIAAASRWPHSSHRNLGDNIKRLFAETNDPEIPTFFKSCENLHVNFYEDNLTLEAVNERARDARLLLRKLRAFLERGEQRETESQ